MRQSDRVISLFVGFSVVVMVLVVAASWELLKFSQRKFHLCLTGWASARNRFLSMANSGSSSSKLDQRTLIKCHRLLAWRPIIPNTTMSPSSKLITANVVFVRQHWKQRSRLSGRTIRCYHRCPRLGCRSRVSTVVVVAVVVPVHVVCV